VSGEVTINGTPEGLFKVSGEVEIDGTPEGLFEVSGEVTLEAPPEGSNSRGVFHKCASKGDRKYGDS